MMSRDMQRVHAVAQEIDKTLRADDPRLSGAVVLHHEDGAALFYDSAFLMRYYDAEHGNWGACTTPGEWIMVFTEHHGFHVYPVDDLVSFQQYRGRMEIEKHPSYPDDKWECLECSSTFIEPTMPTPPLGDRAEHCPVCGLDNVKLIEPK